MTDPDERDQGLEELLRTALRGEADTVTPGGDGLARIQQRVNARRARRAWLRPLAAVGALAVIGGAGFAAYSLTRPAEHAETITTTSPQPSNSPTTTPTPTPTPPVPVSATFPAAGMFPYTSAAAARMGGAPWSNNAVLVAQHFVADFVGIDGVDQVVDASTSGDSGHVTLGRLAGGNRMVPITTVSLAGYQGAWIVVGATDARGLLAITSPTAGARVSSPVTVSGPDYGVDESVRLTLVSPHSTGPLASSNVSFGANNSSWSTKLTFTAPTDPVGAVVAYETSAEDGGPARLAVTAVRFSTTPVQAAGYPRYFYGVKDGRVAKFASRNAAAISFLTAPQPGGGASDPQLVGDRVYYLAGAGTCANTLMSVPSRGGTSGIVATPDPGYVVTAFGVSADAKAIALFETACQPSASRPQGILVSSLPATGTSHTLTFQAFPPTILGNPSWETDDRHVNAVLRTGNTAGPVRWDAFGATNIQDTSTPNSCSAPMQGLPQDLQLDAGGAVWLAVQDGNAMTVQRCVGSTLTTAFTVAGQDVPSELAVTRDGQAVLLTDAAGAVWRWTAGSAAATKLSPAVPLTAVSW